MRSNLNPPYQLTSECMKKKTLKWIELYSKPCWEIRTLKKATEARFVTENDVADLMEYNSEPVSGRLTIERERTEQISYFEYFWYLSRGFEPYQIVRKKF